MGVGWGGTGPAQVAEAGSTGSDGGLVPLPLPPPPSPRRVPHRRRRLQLHLPVLRRARRVVSARPGLPRTGARGLRGSLPGDKSAAAGRASRDFTESWHSLPLRPGRPGACSSSPRPCAPPCPAARQDGGDHAYHGGVPGRGGRGAWPRLTGLDSPPPWLAAARRAAGLVRCAGYPRRCAAPPLLLPAVQYVLSQAAVARSFTFYFVSSAGSQGGGAGQGPTGAPAGQRAHPHPHHASAGVLCAPSGRANPPPPPNSPPPPRPPTGQADRQAHRLFPGETPQRECWPRALGAQRGDAYARPAGPRAARPRPALRAAAPRPLPNGRPPPHPAPQIPWRGYGVDFLAAGLSGGLTILLAFTTFGGATFNLVITLTQREGAVGGAAWGFAAAAPALPPRGLDASGRSAPSPNSNATCDPNSNTTGPPPHPTPPHPTPPHPTPPHPTPPPPHPTPPPPPPPSRDHCSHPHPGLHQGQPQKPHPLPALRRPRHLRRRKLCLLLVSPTPPARARPLASTPCRARPGGSARWAPAVLQLRAH
jgi:hypothetical protein